ncbi:TPA: hypothetical protein KDZ97_003697 [Vibrio parahaemolyticus]|uniref:hypothetical protein n=1 Tax=Vibrio parahaemolyticus TaxID=670 RepID=UPI001B835B09|nr:hypothetical protein [Vibrio parahaemolyticus]MDF5646607.1 hypothetical protein [Vibrio parahaemolyticus]MDF5666135.1 hypothetical protein [Vibrio parahaemolyticus]WKV19387.1 hypothetical protein [Vibrio parahaemolyticus]HBC3404825.1 hypothetical protein [Vibrio parahaemolyticus]HBC3539163.1 hypothetical protein [Vibrio parahaemolyticus]
MNLKNVCELVKAAGQTRAIITIDTNNEDAVIIVNIPTSNAACLPKVEDDKQMALRSALATPMRVLGKIEDVDAVFDEQLAEFGEGFAPASLQLKGVKTNAAAAKASTQAVTTASKTTVKKASNKKNAAKTENADAVETKAATETAPKAPEKADKVETAPTDAVATQDAPEAVEADDEGMSLESDNFDFFQNGAL